MEEVIYTSDLFDFVRKTKEYSIRNEKKSITLEFVRRPPGVRAIVTEGKNILLVREYRYELENWDYRLPGGKVFDTLKSYKLALRSKSVLQSTYDAIKRELLEEVGLVISDPKLYVSTRAGATVEWDLYYFEIKTHYLSKAGQQLEVNEHIYPEWRPIHEVKKMCIEGKIHEDRTVGVLLKYILEHQTRS